MSEEKENILLEEEDESEEDSVIENKKDKEEEESVLDDDSIKDSDIISDDDDDDNESLSNSELELDNIANIKKEQSNFLPPEDDDEDNDEDDDYLQKFDESIKKKIIEEYHPELQNHNYDEVEILSRVIRDQHGIIIDPLHKTLPFITKYEKTRILGERATQLNAGAKSFIEVEPDIIDGYVIALKEFEEKKIPFILKRPLPNGGVEYWKLEDLEVI
jgi:DNA-directed RNA polymerase I, II, and III subunit RPABC2